MLPSVQEIRDFLEGYCVTTTATKTTTGTLVASSAVVTAVPDTSILQEEMIVSGTGIATGTRVKSIDSATQITLDTPAISSGSAVSLTFTYYSILSDYWLKTRRDRFIVPYVEKVTRQSFTGIATAIEYHSGNGKNVLMLDRRPINSVTEIAYVLGGNTFRILNLAMIETVAEEGILKSKTNYDEAFLLPVFAKGEYNIKVTYTYGYSTMPDDIAEAVIYLATYQALNFIGARTGGGSLNVQGFGRNFGQLGKYNDVLKHLSSQAHIILRQYMTGVVGN